MLYRTLAPSQRKIVDQYVSRMTGKDCAGLVGEYDAYLDTGMVRPLGPLLDHAISLFGKTLKLEHSFKAIPLEWIDCIAFCVMRAYAHEAIDD